MPAGLRRRDDVGFHSPASGDLLLFSRFWGRIAQRTVAGDGRTDGGGGGSVVDEGLAVRSMALLRLFSGALEMTAAYLMVRLGRVEDAVRINGLLGLAGPTVLVLVSLLGIGGLSAQVPWPRLGIIACGVLLILLGTR